ncbi:MAG: ComEC/Rec2 family competence protein, partial [Bacteroidota bacterium]|nr:ComEC/Rec2 family competence protein [Bacteroidota bacterium]
NNLFDASFQLSYMAVIGIVYYHPQINNWLSPKNGVLKWLWATISISLAAQLGTFPIILKDFSQFPNYFLLSNILSIPLSFILMGLSLLLPLSLLWSSLNHLTSQTTAFFLDIFNRSTIWFEHLPGAVTQGFHPSSISVAILYALPLIFFLWLKEKKAGYLLGIISLSIILSSFSLYDLIQAEQQNRIIIYNNPDQLTIHLIHGRQSDLIIWDSSVKKHNNINYLTQPVENKYNLHKTQLHWVGQYTSSGIAFSKNFLYFNGKILYNPYKQSDEVRKRPRCNVDYVFLNRIFNKKELEDLKQTFPESEFLVTDRSVSKYMKKKTLILLDLNYISIPDSGALEIDLNRGIEKHDLQKERYVSFLAKK